MDSADCAVAGGPSVLLSVYHTPVVHCVNEAKYIIKLFLPSGSHTILVFPTKRYGIIPTGTPLIGASNAGGMKIRDFRLISCFISEIIQAGVIVTTECE